MVPGRRGDNPGPPRVAGRSLGAVGWGRWRCCDNGSDAARHNAAQRPLFVPSRLNEGVYMHFTSPVEVLFAYLPDC